MDGEVGTTTETRRIVTILFADLVGSTALGERLDPEVARSILGRYYALARGSLERHGGTVEKFVGDAVMAVFGIPAAHEDDALRAGRAALDLRDGLARLSEGLARTHGIGLDLRIGLATGTVVAGDPAAGTTLVTGDAVNLAARLEAAAAIGTILVDDATWRVIRGSAEVEELAPMALKGKEQPVLARRLVGLHDHSLHRRAGGPFVGRTAELGLLEATFRDVVERRRSALVTIVAPPGAGKSRLVAEFAGGIAPGVTILTGQCLSYGEGITYWPIAEIVRAAVGIADGDDAVAARAKLDAEMAGAPDGQDVAARVAAVIGLDPSGAFAGETPWAVRRMLEIVAGRGPLVVVVDDLQWAEPGLLDLLEYTITWASASPLLLLCIARPELRDRRPTWAISIPASTAIQLPPLPADVTASLLDQLAGIPLPIAVLARVGRAAGGNPLFAEQLLAMLVEDGHLQRDDDAWVVRTDLEAWPLPVTIGALLGARLDALPPRERIAITRAAVVGEQFDAAAATELTDPGDPQGVSRCLLALVDRELLRPDRSNLLGGDAFRFHHLLVRDAAYEALPKAERAALHERFGTWLEGAMGDRRTEVEAIVGHHLAEAHAYRALLNPDDPGLVGLAERAAGSFAASASRSMALGDVRGASDGFRRCLALLPATSPRRVGLLPDAAKATLESGNRSAARELLTEARTLAAGTGDARVGAVARIYEMVIEVWSGDPDCVVLRAEAERLIGALAELGDERGESLGWSLVAEIEWYREEVVAAYAAILAAIDHAERAGDRWMRAEYLALAAPCTPTPAERELDRRAMLARAGDGYRIVAARQLPQIGVIVAGTGRIDEGRGMVAEGVGLCHELGLPIWAGEMSVCSAILETIAGDLEAAEGMLTAGLDLLGPEDRMHVGTLQAIRSRVLQRLGRLDDAEVAAAAAAPPADAVRIGMLDALALAVQAGILARRGQHAEATVAVDRVLTRLTGAKGDLDVYLYLSPGIAAAEALVALGRTEEAGSLAAAALAEAEAAGAPAWVAARRAELAAAGIWPPTGDPR